MPMNNLKENMAQVHAEDEQKLAQAMAQAALDKKAVDVVILDIRNKTSVADYFVIASAPSERQVQAIIRNVEDELKNWGIRPQCVEGFKAASWIVLDYQNIIFHCFTESARKYYDLEGFWVDAKRIELVLKTIS
jgi:ribosome-associated protein